MKLVTATAIVLLAACFCAEAGAGWLFDNFIKIGGSETTGVRNEKGCKSNTSWGGSGHQMAVLPDIGQASTEGEPGQPVNLAGFQSQSDNTTTNTADLSAALDFVRSSQSDYTKAGQDATQSDTGDKNRAGPSTATAVTGQGISNAPQNQPNATGQPTNTQTVNAAELKEFVEAAKANKEALDAAAAENAALKARLAELEANQPEQ